MVLPALSDGLVSAPAFALNAQVVAMTTPRSALALTPRLTDGPFVSRLLEDHGEDLQMARTRVAHRIAAMGASRRFEFGGSLDVGTGHREVGDHHGDEHAEHEDDDAIA